MEPDVQVVHGRTKPDLQDHLCLGPPKSQSFGLAFFSFLASIMQATISHKSYCLFPVALCLLWCPHNVRLWRWDGYHGTFSRYLLSVTLLCLSLGNGLVKPKEDPDIVKEPVALVTIFTVLNSQLRNAMYWSNKVTYLFRSAGAWARSCIELRRRDSKSKNGKARSARLILVPTGWLGLRGICHPLNPLILDLPRSP